MLRSYQDALKPGMTRKQVEGYLKSKSVPFGRTNGVNSDILAADITKIGEEESPWYCSRNNIYVAFEFNTLDVISSDPKDILDKVTLYERLEDCL